MPTLHDVSHAPGPDGLPICHCKRGAVVHGADPTCDYCRKRLGLPRMRAQAVRATIRKVTSRKTYVQRVHECLAAAFEASGGEPIRIFDTLAAAGMTTNHTRSPVRKLAAVGAIIIERKTAPAPRKTFKRTMAVCVQTLFLVGVRPLTDVPRPTVTPAAKRMARQLAKAASPTWQRTVDLVAPIIAAGASASLVQSAIYEAVRRGWVETTGRGAPSRIRALRQPEPIGPTPAKPRRIATPGAKAKPPRLATDVEVVPACERYDADGLPVALSVPTPEPTPAATAIVETLTWSATPNWRGMASTGRHSDRPAIRRVDVEPLLDAQTAAELRGLFGEVTP